MILRQLGRTGPNPANEARIVGTQKRRLILAATRQCPTPSGDPPVQSPVSDRHLLHSGPTTGPAPHPAHRPHHAYRGRVFESDLGLQGGELTARAWDSVLTRSAKSYARGIWSSEGVARTELQRVLLRPRLLPVIADALLGRDGTIWLRKESGGSEEAEWLVLTPAGRQFGIVKLPASTRILDVSATGALGVTRDEDDLEHPFWMRVMLP